MESIVSGVAGGMSEHAEKALSVSFPFGGAFLGVFLRFRHLGLTAENRCKPCIY